jgi:hypothetical protein
MSVIQPLYYTNGRYSAGIDRKLIAALIGSDSNGGRLSGVIRSNEGTNSMRVIPQGSNASVEVKPGLCVIADTSSNSGTSPGVYVCGIDGSNESINLAAYAGTDVLIYAEVDTTSLTVVGKALTSNVATIFTVTTSQIRTNNTMVVTGVDDIFDGSWAITGVNGTNGITYSRPYTGGSIATTPVTPSVRVGATSTSVTQKAYNATTGIAYLTSSKHGFASGEMFTVKGVDPTYDGTFRYDTAYGGGVDLISYKVNRTLNAVSSTYQTLSTSSNANVQIPFSIKATAWSTYSTDLATKTYIPLAKVSAKASIAASDITDARQFVALSGGVHVYSTGIAMTNSQVQVDGKLRWNTSNKTLDIYDATAATTKIIYNNSGIGEVHPRLGSTSTTAAAGDHVHTTPNGVRLGRASDTTDTAYNYFNTSSYTGVGGTLTFNAASLSTILLISYKVTVKIENYAGYMSITPVIDPGTTGGTALNAGDSFQIFGCYAKLDISGTTTQTTSAPSAGTAHTHTVAVDAANLSPKGYMTVSNTTVYVLSNTSTGNITLRLNAKLSATPTASSYMSHLDSHITAVQISPIF